MFKMYVMVVTPLPNTTVCVNPSIDLQFRFKSVEQPMELEKHNNGWSIVLCSVGNFFDWIMSTLFLVLTIIL